MFLHPYLNGITRLARRLLPVGVSLFFLAVVWCDLGQDYNLPALFWYADYWPWQLLGGLAVGLLLAYVWLIAFLVDIQHDRLFVEEGLKRGHAGPLRWLIAVMTWLMPVRKDEQPFWPAMRWYLSLTWLPIIVLLAVPVARDPAARWPFLAGLLLAALLFGRVFPLLVRVVAMLSEPGEVSLRRFAQSTFTFLLVSYALACVFRHDGLPPVVSFCLVLGVLAGLAGAIWYHFDQPAPAPVFFQVPALVVFAVLFGWVVFCNSWAYKLRFPGLAEEYGQPLALAADEEPEAPTDERNTRADVSRVWDLCERLERQKDPRLAATPRPEAPPGIRYREVYDRYQELVREIDDQEERRLERWRQGIQARTGIRKPRLVVVAVTGGANRASLWTYTVLHQLEGRLHGSGSGRGTSPFSSHVRIVSGASGGMVGAAHFVAGLGPDSEPAYDPGLIGADYLTPIVNRLSFRETPFLFLPVPSYGHDRGQALDAAIERTGAALGPAGRPITFDDLLAGEMEGWRPSLIFSPMLVEDGRRLLISNLNLPFLAGSEGAFLLPGGRQPRTQGPDQRPRPFAQSIKQSDEAGRDRYSRSAVEFFRLFPQARGRLRLSTAARMSATFPYVSPAVDLPTDPPRRVVDAGYYDNYGVNVAARWVYRFREWIRANTSGVLLIQVRDGRSQDHRRYLGDPEEDNLKGWRKRLETGTQWLTSPPTGAVTARESVMSFRNDEQVEVLDAYFHSFPYLRGQAEPFFTTAVFERPGAVGMNWYLRPSDRELIVRGMDDKINQDALELIEKWWKKGD
jgi:hypothetical protein